MEVTWNEDVCRRSGYCVRILPEVFRIEDEGFVIDPSKASEERVRYAVAHCPSGALQIKENQ